MSQKKPWAGRFSEDTDALMETFSESVSFDWRLYRQDIRGSIAHARMLQAAGVLSEEDFGDIERGLREIESDIERGAFQWSESLEDVHMNIEAELTRRIGDAGKRLHTGRSRNDQVATDMRLYLREGIDRIASAMTGLQRTLVDLAGKEAGTIMPGYTHMQSAQPVTLGHHILAWNEMLDRDYQRLLDCRERVNVSPLGAAALAGTGYPIDRQMTADELGFGGVCANSLDAVSDRDFVIEFGAAAALIMVHLSRIAEELVLWSSEGSGFVELGDAFCTGSSIMPQKKNPDVAELIRGKSGRVSGNLVALLMVMKGQPLAYNRDNQEDKEPLFDSMDTVEAGLRVFSAMFAQVTFHREAMYRAASRGHPTATDLADYLVRKGVPFRDAHGVVARIVDHAARDRLQLEQVPLSVMQQHSDVIGADVYDVLTLEGSVASRNHVGGTAPEQVTIAAENAARRLQERGA
ncbi:MAG: argininosuccinate lyase [Gammaproteobacteria bacterium]|nr:argininosuccinate lyase [Gammaproteobacteria bacterium]